MLINTRIKLALAFTLAYSTYGQAAAPTGASEPSRPEVIRNLEQQGVEIMGEFQAPGGLRGFAGVSEGAPVTLYVTPDGAHVIAGTLLNSKGEDPSAAEVQRLVVQPMSQRIWAQLERSHWVVDGDAKAKRVVYAFTDPNCPYCHRFWEASRRWIQSGKVQVRHILVGVIRADSANKAAAILTAKAPSDAFTLNEQRQAEGGIQGLEKIPAEVQAKLDENARLMEGLGFQGTPGILFRDETGVVQSRSGMPAPEDMRTVLGPF
ncbi:MAG TPA: thiol:disulfide interchange protein DsbG [Steroidobacter sp.]|nr:thiol:disulfide interchange protein DsbG [Steroidobacter sp.]